MKIYLLTCLGFFIANIIYAQQEAHFTQYMFNPNAINPAYTGSRQSLSILALSRKQWVGFEGAPVTHHLNINSPFLNDELGAGLTVMNDKIGPIQQSGLHGDIVYRLKLEKSFLAFGIKAGINLLQGSFANLKIINNQDQNFQNNLPSKILPNFGFGIYYHSDKYFIGASAPRLVKNSVDIQTGSSNLMQITVQNLHYYLIAGYIFNINHFLKFKPTSLVKITEGAPPSVDISANFLFHEKLWLGAMYRSGDAVASILTLQLTDQLRAGYSYDYTISKLRRYNSGSHEIMIGYDFKYKKAKIKSPRYF